jgi:hypothetical protein
MDGWVWVDGTCEGDATHVEGFKVFADFGDELLAALVALGQPCVWLVCLGQG